MFDNNKDRCQELGAAVSRMNGSYIRPTPDRYEDDKYPELTAAVRRMNSECFQFDE